MLFFNIVILPFFPIAASWPIKQIYNLIFERLFSYAIDKGIIAYNVLLIETIVDEEVEEYLEVYRKAENLPKDSPKEVVNEVANELFKVSEKLWSNRRPGKLL